MIGIDCIIIISKTNQNINQNEKNYSAILKKKLLNYLFSWIVTKISRYDNRSLTVVRNKYDLGMVYQKAGA